MFFKLHAHVRKIVMCEHIECCDDSIRRIRMPYAYACMVYVDLCIELVFVGTELESKGQQTGAETTCQVELPGSFSLQHLISVLKLKHMMHTVPSPDRVSSSNAMVASSFYEDLAYGCGREVNRIAGVIQVCVA